MKKLQRKRFVALLMAITMAFSFSMVAFAAENEENTDIVISEAFAKQNDSGNMSAGAEVYNLSGYYLGTTRKTETFQITVPEGGAYLYFSFMGTGSANVTLYAEGVSVSRIFISKGGSDDYAITKYPFYEYDSVRFHYWAGGVYTVTVNIPFDCKWGFFIAGTTVSLVD